MEICESCQNILIEIDHYGERLIGCISCNKWARPADSRSVMGLPEGDIASLRGIQSEEEPIAKELVEVFLAVKSSEGVESYVTRGRRLRDLNDAELAGKFAEAVRAWAANLLGDNLLISDVSAEYELRGGQAPRLETIPEFATIKVAVQRAIEQMSEVQMNELSADVYAEFKRVKKGRH